MLLEVLTLLKLFFVFICLCFSYLYIKFACFFSISSSLFQSQCNTKYILLVLQMHAIFIVGCPVPHTSTSYIRDQELSLSPVCFIQIINILTNTNMHKHVHANCDQSKQRCARTGSPTRTRPRNRYNQKRRERMRLWGIS